MKTIQTKPGVTLGFFKEPQGVKLPFPNLLAELVSFDKKQDGTYGSGKTIGRLSEITEEQAAELVPDKLEPPSHPIVSWQRDLTALELLSEAAGFLGIKPEEFDQYLVIKL